MKAIKIIIILTVILFAGTVSSNAQLQVGSTSFMIHPGDEEPPIGVYPNKTEGGQKDETDSLKNDLEDKTLGSDTTTKGKDANGNPPGTLYTPGDRITEAACKVGDALIDVGELATSLDEWIGRQVVHWTGATEKNNMTSGTKNNRGTKSGNCQAYSYDLKEFPVDFNKTIRKQFSKKAKLKKWIFKDKRWYYISKNKTNRYFYAYISKSKPNAKKPVKADRFKIVVRKKKIIVSRYN